MATDQERLRTHIIQCAVESIPRPFLEEVHRRTATAYRDVFHEVKQDPTVLDEQRLLKLAQDRVFRMERELSEAAKAHDLPITAKPVAENNWSYAYVVSGRFGITQAYIPPNDRFPHPAKYRDELARASGVPRLPLDDPREIYEAKDFYALFAHTQIGSRFTEEHQGLGVLRLCVPSGNGDKLNRWALKLSVVELMSHYPSEAPQAKPQRAPTWKRDLKRGGL